MKVLHIAHVIKGGIASFLDEMAGFQAEALGEHNVNFLVPAGSEGSLPNAACGSVFTFEPVDRSPSSLVMFALSSRRLINLLRPDIVHLHSSFAGTCVRLVLPWLGSRPKVIYCPHGWSFTMDVGSLARRAYVGVEKALVPRADLIIVNSESERQVALAEGLPEARLRTIDNGIAWTDRTERDVDASMIRLAFVGRNARQKGLDLLIAAIAAHPLPGIEFHVIGDDGSDFPHGVNGHRFVFHGWCDRAETLSLLTRMDAVIMPSRWDAAPMAALEALRNGLAVIGSNRGGLPDIVGHGEGGYIFDLDDPAGLVSLLQSLDKDALGQLGKGARARWERRFQASLMNERTLGAYRDVLVARAPAAGASSIHSPTLTHEEANR